MACLKQINIQNMFPQEIISLNIYLFQKGHSNSKKFTFLLFTALYTQKNDLLGIHKFCC